LKNIIQKNILIVDDDLMFTMLLSKTLKENKLPTFCSSSAIEAYHSIKKNSPDLILLDIILPDLNGLEFISFMRYCMLELNTPVILMSVLNSEEIVNTGMRLGASEYFQKPLDFNLLIPSVKKYLQ
jgi:DNA-binding response OmpR family regulator